MRLKDVISYHRIEKAKIEIEQLESPFVSDKDKERRRSLLNFHKDVVNHLVTLSINPQIQDVECRMSTLDSGSAKNARQ